MTVPTDTISAIALCLYYKVKHLSILVTLELGYSFKFHAHLYYYTVKIVGLSHFYQNTLQA